MNIFSRTGFFLIRAIVCFSCLFFCVSVSRAAQINVPADYPTIQAAIDAASNGDIVLVAAGIYPERIILKYGVSVKGAGPEVTFLDGGGTGPIVWIPDTARADTTSFSGFTVQNGYDGIYRSDEGAGSGIYIDWYGSATIEDNVIFSEGDYGIFVMYSPVDSIIRNNIIHGNKRYAIANYNGEPVIEKNILYGNDWAGIESWNPSGRPIIRNNTIVDNIGTGWARGVIFGNGSRPQVFENNIIAHNAGEGIFLYSHDSLTLPLTIFYNCVFGNGTPHNENILLDSATSVTDDPLLLDISIHDYTIALSSPCIDAGNPGSQFNDEDGSRNDMGAGGGTGNGSGDLAPPYVYGHAPVQTVGVSQTSSIQISIADMDPGVNIATVTLEVNGHRIFDGSNQTAYPESICSGTPAAYTITYTPPVPYASGEKIAVIVNGQDLNSNVMAQYGFSFIVVPYAPETIHVPEDFPTIQEGIGSARYGDTVIVGIGLFNENITLKDGLTLQGAGPCFSTIRGIGGNAVVTMASDCTIQGFTITAAYSSHGVYCWKAPSLIRNNLILSTFSTATDYGVFASNESSPEILNNTIIGFFYGIYVSIDEAPLVQNNIIAACRSAGIRNDDRWNVYPVLEYNNIYDNATDYEGCVPGTGDMSEDPLFTDAGSNNYTLTSGSVCIDAGHPDSGNNDIDGSRNDMGAYGGPGQACDPSAVLASFAAGFGNHDNLNFQGDMNDDQDIDGEDLADLTRIFNQADCTR